MFGRAYVRLDEHREHFAFDPNARATPISEVAFLDEDGSAFRVVMSAPVDVASAKAALVHWLAIGKPTPTLQWS